MRTGKLVVLAMLCTSHLLAQSLEGRWSATVNVKGVEIPFRFDLSDNGSHITGFFFNGNEKVSSTAGQFQNGSLVLHFDAYAAKLEATLAGDALQGQYLRGANPALPFQAKRYVPEKTDSGNIPKISGEWELQTNTHYGESALLLLIQQSGAHVNAAISRVDGDTGNLDGTYKDGKFILSHFDGARPLLLEVTPASDGSLHVIQNDKTNLIAWRPAAARERNLAPPVDPAQHTHVRNPSEPLHFSFPDLNGHLVTNADPRFRGKVVLVTITGSWCPNCHDEAPFLESLYRKYRSRGLEIVALSFEEKEQLDNPTRLKAFIKEYGIDYTVLVAGEPDQLAEKVPQAVNLDAIPSIFFLDRTGGVQSVHAGFAGVATGDLYKRLEEETTEKVEHLLAGASQSVNSAVSTELTRAASNR